MALLGAAMRVSPARAHLHSVLPLEMTGSMYSWVWNEKKADAVEHPGVLNRVGLLVNGPPGTAGLPFI